MLLFLAALLTATLVACGDGGGSAAEQPSNQEVTAGTPEPTPEPTRDVETQQGSELTTEEYAEAMEEIIVAQEEEGAALVEEFEGDALFSRENDERVTALWANDSWSQEDAEFASGFAESFLKLTADLSASALEILADSFDEMSRLTPPEHLSDLHGDLIAALRECLQIAQDFMESMLGGLDTNIGDRDELVGFMEMVGSLMESGPSISNPDLQERIGGVCDELEDQLEAELGREVSVC